MIPEDEDGNPAAGCAWLMILTALFWTGVAVALWKTTR